MSKDLPVKKKAKKKAKKKKLIKKSQIKINKPDDYVFGRPSLLNDQIKHVMLKLYEEGKTDRQIAEIIGVSPRTLDYWKKSDENFLQTISDIKDLPDKFIEATLFQKALGYSHKEEKVFCSEGQIVTYETTKQYPPDSASMIFWLKNRQPDRWRERQESEKDVVNVTVNVEQKELEDRIKLLKD